MIDPPQSQSFHFSTRVGPQWNNIELLRTAVRNGAQAVFGEGDVSEVVGMITSELMENAVKYGDWRAPDRIWLRVAVVSYRRFVRIEVECPIEAGSEHLEHLREMLRWIDSFPSPQEAFLARMHEIAERGDKDGESGMGLVRVACEGPCRFDTSLGEGGVLTVRATMDLGETAATDAAPER